MNKEEKLTLIVGLSMIVVGTAGMITFLVMADRIEKKSSEERRERYRQHGWEMIQRSRMFTSSDEETRIKLFDAYWKTSGGVKPFTP